MSEIKAWRCQHGHVMGQVQRNGSGVRHLLLYREAVDIEGEPADVDVLAIVEGHVADVRCSICGSMRTWVPGQEALDRLVARVLEMRAKEI